jgi:hypothetical protein
LAKYAACLLCGIRLPTVENLGQLVTLERLDYDVYVVGHDAPSHKPIARTVEMLQGIRDDLSDLSDL